MGNGGILFLFVHCFEDHVVVDDDRAGEFSKFRDGVGENTNITRNCVVFDDCE